MVRRHLNTLDWNTGFVRCVESYHTQGIGMWVGMPSIKGHATAS